MKVLRLIARILCINALIATSPSCSLLSWDRPGIYYGVAVEDRDAQLECQRTMAAVAKEMELDPVRQYSESPGGYVALARVHTLATRAVFLDVSVEAQGDMAYVALVCDSPYWCIADDATGRLAAGIVAGMRASHPFAVIERYQPRSTVLGP